MPTMTTSPVSAPLSIGEIAQRIHLIRGQRVVLDTDLAAFYGETTKRFNQQVNRNLNRFPPGFMFQLDEQEFANLRLQFATSSLRGGHGGRRYAPLAFTEHGAIMASMVLNSPRATELSVYVVQAFVELRGMAASNRELAGKVHSLERKVSVHERNIAELVTLAKAGAKTATGAPRLLYRRTHIVVGIAAVTGVVGYLQYATGLPWGLVAVHMLLAALFIVAVTMLVEALPRRAAA